MLCDPDKLITLVFVRKPIKPIEIIAIKSLKTIFGNETREWNFFNFNSFPRNSVNKL